MKALSRFNVLAFAVSCIAWVAARAQTPDLTKASTSATAAQFDYFVRLNAPKEEAFVAVQRVAEPHLQARQWQKAVEIFRLYRSFFSTMESRFDGIITILEAKEAELKVLNLGSGVNTAADEFVPIPTADGSGLYFTAVERPGGHGGEDIFVSDFRNGVWQEALNLGTGINTQSHEFICSISADENKIILLGNYEQSLGRGDQFYTFKTAEGWSSVRHFPPPINSKNWDCDGFMTSDGKAVLFTSDRPGDIGGFNPKGELFHGDYWGNTDMYVCLLTENGWSEPINLGTSINTPYSERSPFLHPDGRTLYFSSSGHYGLGRLDAFKTMRLRDDSWTEWSDPVNLGKEINTPGDDWGYKLSTSGEVAYFSAEGKTGGFGGEDIYAIALPKEAQPEKVVTIRGKVVDAADRPLEASIRWEDLATGKNVGQLKSDPQDGSYFIALPLGKNYGYYVERQGYYPTSRNLDLQYRTESQNVVEDIVLVSIEEIAKTDAAVRINNIFFDLGEFTLLPSSYPELNRLAVVLNENPSLKVEIGGHTDNLGSEGYNRELSKQRAQTVVAYLIAHECNPANLTAEGYGESQPIASNQTEEGRQQNRRVEFRIFQATATK